MPAKIKYPVIDGKKECGDCGQWKPITEYKKARNHYTSRCLGCLKIYASQYRQRPEVKIKAAKYIKEYRSIPEKKEIINARGRKRNKKPEVQAKRNEQRRHWALREKQKAVEYKGGSCEICGYNKCLAAMDFHHRDPLEKNGYGTGALKQHWTFEKNKKEIDKCILVCVRCHREIHAGFITI